MELQQVLTDFANVLLALDASGVPHKKFRPGVGPYGEPQLLKAIVERLATAEPYTGRLSTRRTPDVLIAGEWALEFKLARPFGDNGKEAENWSVNLLHPYPGNTSVVGDCLKLEQWTGPERRAAVVIGYEHTPPLLSLRPLFLAFEAVARTVGLQIGSRVEIARAGLVHPVHQQLTVIAWEVLPKHSSVEPSQPVCDALSCESTR